MQSGYDFINNLKQELRSYGTKANVRDLIVLANQNDPFYAGTPTDWEMARWFMELWARYGYSLAVHLRRIHYQHVSQAAPKKHGGQPYENTEGDWGYLCNAGKYARDLGLLDAKMIVDHRNPAPTIYSYSGGILRPEYFIDDLWSLGLPSLDSTDLRLDDWDPPELGIRGYSNAAARQPYHLEVWCEKSTMNDVLHPLCERYGVDYVTGLGFMSDRSAEDLVERAVGSGKPTRVFYVSDYDPAGVGMPIALARRVEWKARAIDGVDLKLLPVVLTSEQVHRYDLPRTPVKDTDRRKGKWEMLHGEGAVELDALQALHPGELAGIIRPLIRRYRDATLGSRLLDAHREARDILGESVDGVWSEVSDDVDNLRSRVEGVVGLYGARFDALVKEFEAEMQPLRDSELSLRQVIKQKIRRMDVALPLAPEPDVAGDSGLSWLYDSSRDYLEQVQAYKEWQRGKQTNGVKDSGSDGHA